MPIPPSSFPTHWLGVRFGHLGDVLLTTGVFEHMGVHAGLTFDVLTKEAWAPVFEGHPHVRKTLVLPDECTSMAQLLAYMKALAQSYARQNATTGLLDLHGNLRSLVLKTFWKNGPICSYPKYSLERRLFMLSGKRMGAETLRATSVAQRYALAFQAAGMLAAAPENSLLRPKIWLSAEERENAASALGMAGLPPGAAGTRPVALHPYAAHPEKTWPREQWLHLAALLEQAGIPWIAVGRGENFFPHKGASFINHCTLRQSAALLSCCRALVTGDSGPMHLASAVGTPVVALFGPTTREWGFFPTGERDRVLELPLPCRPCSLHGNSSCPLKGKCLKDLAPEAVMESLRHSGQE